MRDELDERVKKVEQLVEDLVKIDRAIQRREERAAKYDQQLAVGRDKLEELKRLQYEEKMYQEQREREERSKKEAAEAAAKKAAAEKAAAEKAAAEKRAAEERRAVEQRQAAEKRAAEERQAAEKVAEIKRIQKQEEERRGAVQNGYDGSLQSDQERPSLLKG